VPLIAERKSVYPVSPPLGAYLRAHHRWRALPIRYPDLTRYTDTVPVYDKHGRDTLWQSVLYPRGDKDDVARALLQTYASLRVMGDASLLEHLVTDRIDVATYGNTQPFRIRILNTLNENFDYFYVKRADANRIYGLELEHLLSPNRLEFFASEDSLVEEHIAGIPGDVFFREHLHAAHLDEVRLSKEFVKFNERCLLRLLGDMHAGNFVVVVTQDFDETAYRIRAIDFDQQSHEGRASVYLPQYYKENNPLVFMGMRCMSARTVRQYQEEERALMRLRAQAEPERLAELIDAMDGDVLAPAQNVTQLGAELARLHRDPAFRQGTSMGAHVRRSLDQLGWRAPPA
jgi:hypothetical protein